MRRRRRLWPMPRDVRLSLADCAWGLSHASDGRQRPVHRQSRVAASSGQQLLSEAGRRARPVRTICFGRNARSIRGTRPGRARRLTPGSRGPDDRTFTAGYDRLCATHPELSRVDLSDCAKLLRLGTRLWREGRRDRDPGDDVEDDANGTRRSPSQISKRMRSCNWSCRLGLLTKDAVLAQKRAWRDHAQAGPSMRSASVSEGKRSMMGRRCGLCAPSLTSSDAWLKESCEYRQGPLQHVRSARRFTLVLKTSEAVATSIRDTTRAKHGILELRHRSCKRI